MKRFKSKEELLDAYEKISATFDDFTLLIRNGIPYEEYPDHGKIARVSEDLLGKSEDVDVSLSVPTQSVSTQKDVWDVLRQRGINPLGSLSTDVITRLEDIGRAQQKLKSIIDDDIFDNLSKHDPFWDSTYESECDRLHDIRMKLNCLRDNLWDLWAILRREEE